MISQRLEAQKQANNYLVAQLQSPHPNGERNSEFLESLSKIKTDSPWSSALALQATDLLGDKRKAGLSDSDPDVVRYNTAVRALKVAVVMAELSMSGDLGNTGSY